MPCFSEEVQCCLNSCALYGHLLSDIACWITSMEILHFFKCIFSNVNFHIVWMWTPGARYAPQTIIFLILKGSNVKVPMEAANSVRKSRIQIMGFRWLWLPGKLWSSFPTDIRPFSGVQNQLGLWLLPSLLNLLCLHCLIWMYTMISESYHLAQSQGHQSVNFQ